MCTISDQETNFLVIKCKLEIICPHNFAALNPMHIFKWPWFYKPLPTHFQSSKWLLSTTHIIRDTSGIFTYMKDHSWLSIIKKNTRKNVSVQCSTLNNNNIWTLITSSIYYQPQKKKVKLRTFLLLTIWSTCKCKHSYTRMCTKFLL